LRRSDIWSQTLLLVCTLALLLGSGCVATRSGHEKPWADALREQILPPESGQAAQMAGSGLARQAAIPDRPITLDEAVAIALSSNPSVAIAASEVSLAKGSVDVARSLFLPHVSGTFQAIGSEAQPAFVDPGNPAMSPFYAGDKAFRQAEVGVQMLLWDFGRSLGTYRQSVLAREIASLKRQRSVQVVRLQVTEAYFDILRAIKARFIAEESLGQANAHLRTARSFLSEGLVDRNDVLRAELRVAEVRQMLIKASNAVELATAAFNRALGANIYRHTEVVDRASLPVVEPPIHEALQTAVDNRPEVKVLKKGLRIQEVGIGVARAGHLPRIYAGGGYRWTDDGYRKWGKGGNEVRGGAWAAQIGIQIEPFSGGRTLAKTRIAREKLRLAEEQARQMCAAIALQVKSALLGLDEARQRVVVADSAIAQARENLRLVNNKYAATLVSSIDVVDAETALSTAQSNYHSAVYDSQVALARLEAAIGTHIGGVDQ